MKVASIHISNCKKLGIFHRLFDAHQQRHAYDCHGQTDDQLHPCSSPLVPNEPRQGRLGGCQSPVAKVLQTKFSFKLIHPHGHRAETLTTRMILHSTYSNISVKCCSLLKCSYLVSPPIHCVSRVGCFKDVYTCLLEVCSVYTQKGHPNRFIYQTTQV